ncbi:hypothetical protein ABLA17_19515 [Vibrio parahaemolyticus]
MKEVRWAFLALLFVSNTTSASSKVDQEAALKAIFKGINSGVEDSVASHYRAKYIDLINKNIGDLTDYKGLDCYAKVLLSSNGRVELVELANQNLLCRKFFNVVWDIGSFPFPNDVVKANELRRLSFSIVP